MTLQTAEKRFPLEIAWVQCSRLIVCRAFSRQRLPTASRSLIKFAFQSPLAGSPLRSSSANGNGLFLGEWVFIRNSLHKRSCSRSFDELIFFFWKMVVIFEKSIHWNILEWVSLSRVLFARQPVAGEHTCTFKYLAPSSLNVWRLASWRSLRVLVACRSASGQPSRPLRIRLHTIQLACRFHGWTLSLATFLFWTSGWLASLHPTFVLSCVA